MQIGGSDISMALGSSAWMSFRGDLVNTLRGAAVAVGGGVGVVSNALRGAVGGVGSSSGSDVLGSDMSMVLANLSQDSSWAHMCREVSKVDISGRWGGTPEM
ncbi:hypothetical protein FOA52_005282 [Chlamydomonas sp. UWO 241]|nr:hypothetical protein FOA52_005282 [Chlamydomonas sp. UWO 241]